MLGILSASSPSPDRYQDQEHFELAPLANTASSPSNLPLMPPSDHHASVEIYHAQPDDDDDDAGLEIEFPTKSMPFSLFC